MKSIDTIRHNLNYDDYGTMFDKKELVPASLRISITTLLSFLAEDIQQIFCRKDKIISKQTAYKIVAKLKQKKYDKIYKQLMKFDGKFNQYLDKFRAKLFVYNDLYGHPIFGPNYSFDEAIRELNKLNNVDVSRMVENHNGKLMIRRLNSVDRVLKMWCPQIWETLGEQKHSLSEQIINREQFFRNMYRIFIKQSLKSKNENIFRTVESAFLSGFPIVNGNNPVANFPADVANYIHSNYLSQEKFKPADVLKVGDLSMGWNGRLAGLMAAQNKNGKLAGRQVKLVGTDVNLSLNETYRKLFNAWCIFVNPDMKFELLNSNVPAESIFEDDIFLEEKGEVHLILSSPPYFNKEKYSEDPNQSYLKYTDYDIWRDQFLKKYIQNSYDLLCPEGELFLNIADITYNGEILPLEKDTLSIAKEIGFELEETILLKMSSLPNSATKRKNTIQIDGKTFKHEPIFRFIK